MKGRSFWLKAALACAAVAALGAGAALVALKVYFPEPKLRAWAVDAARRQLGRDVRLEGIGVGLGGATLRGLEVSERPDFSAGAFLKVASFRLRPSWKALLRRKVVIASVAADGLDVRVVKGKDGHFNYETLASSAPAGAAAPAKSSESGPPELAVRRASISNGTIRYADEAAGASWTVSELDLDLRDFSLAAPFTIETSLRVRGKAGARPVDARLAFAGRVDLARGKPEGFKAEAKKLTVEAEGLKLAASGKAARLDAPEVAFDASLSASGKTLLDASGTAKLGGGAADFDVKAKTPGLDTTLLAKLAPQAGVPALTLPAAEAAAAGRWAGDKADVKSFRLSWAGGKVEGAVFARGLGTAKAAYDGHAAFGLDVPEIRPGQYPFLKLPPKAWVPAMRVDGEAELAGEDLKLPSLKIATKAGTVSVSGVVRKALSAKPSPQLNGALALDLPSFKASDLPVAVAGVPPGLVVPPLKIGGGVKVSGDDVRFDKLVVKAKEGRVQVDGMVAKALAGAPVPDVDVAAELALPALTDKELPFPGVPAGLSLPASHWTAAVSYSPKAARVRDLRVQIGRNDLAVSGSVADPAGRGAFDLILKCRSFVLEELTQLTPQTRDLKLAGSGFFALSVTGTKQKPVYAGKMRFQGLGATIAQLPLSDFAGTLSFDERRIDLPNLTGKVADGALKMDLTVKDYARLPEIQLDADLDRFDLGKYLAAKNQVAAQRAAAKAAKPAAAEEKPRMISTRGHLNVGTLIHPNATVSDVKVAWDLHSLTPDFKDLSGDARLHVGGGRIRSVGDMATQSKLVKVLLFPLLIVQKIGRLGGIRLFPDFNDIALNQIVGDYAFRDGVMTLRQSEMDSSAARVGATGAIDLPREGLDLVVTAQVANVAPIDVKVTGSFDQPKTNVNVAKFLATPAAQLIKGLIQK